MGKPDVNSKDMRAAMTTIAFAIRQIVQNARQIIIVRDKKLKNVVMNQPFIKMGNAYQKLRAYHLYLQLSLVRYLRQQRNHYHRVKEIVHFWLFYEFNFPGLSCLCISR